MTLTVGSLFSGIGGIDLGLERAGMVVRWQVEIDEYCQRVLAKHWPDITRYSDINDLTGDELEPVDLISAGFPCQPVSLAGQRKGQDDERWLWPATYRIICLVRPRFVLLENVPGLLSRGMSDVLGDLAESGYDAEWDCIPAAAVGAPHLRYRVFVVAYTNSTWEQQPGRSVSEIWERTRDCSSAITISDTNSNEHKCSSSSIGRTKAENLFPNANEFGAGRLSQTIQTRESESCSDSRHVANPDGTRLEIWQHEKGLREFSAAIGVRQWAVEPAVCRVAHGIPNRVDRLRGLGNAVVPQVAEWIGRRIVEAA